MIHILSLSSSSPLFGCCYCDLALSLISRPPATDIRSSLPQPAHKIFNTHTHYILPLVPPYTRCSHPCGAHHNPWQMVTPGPTPMLPTLLFMMEPAPSSCPSGALGTFTCVLDDVISSLSSVIFLIHFPTSLSSLSFHSYS